MRRPRAASRADPSRPRASSRSSASASLGIAPGIFQTPMIAGMRDGCAKSLAGGRHSVPRNCLGNAGEEYADSLATAAWSENRYLNGDTRSVSTAQSAHGAALELTTPKRRAALLRKWPVGGSGLRPTRLICLSGPHRWAALCGEAGGSLMWGRGAVRRDCAAHHCARVAIAGHASPRPKKPGGGSSGGPRLRGSCGRREKKKKKGERDRSCGKSYRRLAGWRDWTSSGKK